MTLAVNGLTLQIAKKKLIHNLSFQVKSGSILSIMGPSGCGKSSLLAFIAGTLPSAFQQSGSVFLNDQNITAYAPYRRKIGLQFQDHLLFPHMTVGENLAFALPRKYPSKERQGLITQALQESSMADYAQANPANLSGGQKARICLMRTLLSEPAALLLDEPFSKLDHELQRSFRAFVFAQVKAYNIPSLMVTHDHNDLPEQGEVLTLKRPHTDSGS